MEALAFIIGLSGPLQQSIQAINDLQHRYEVLQSHESDAGMLLERYNALLTGLEDLSRDHQATLSRLPEHDRLSISTSLAEIRTLLESSAKQIVRLQEELRNPFKRYRRANRTEEVFKIKIAETEKLDQKVLTISCMLRTIAAQPSSSSDEDCFVPSNTAPINPGSLAMDFESTDASGMLSTCEGRLKAEVLGDAMTVGAVASGGGGVGKTCALLAIAQEKDVLERFPGGIYFMRLGHDATVGTVIGQLASSVSASGGLKLSRQVQEEDHLSAAIAHCKRWFAQHVCLFMFDDLWESNDIEDDILRTISGLISSVNGPRGSRLVYTTRQTELAQQGSLVSFSPRSPFGSVSRTMLLQAAGVDAASAEVSHCHAAIKRVLQKCAGLPVALSLAGRNIRILRSELGENRAENAWLQYANALEEEEGTLVSEHIDGYPTLRSAIVVSLEYLDKHRGTFSSRHGDLCFRDMHQALCVLQRQQWISVGALTVLWGIEDEKATLAIVKKMVRVGLADSECRNSADGFIFGLRLHDLVHDVVTFETRNGGASHVWHARFVEGYRLSLGCKSLSADWPVRLPNDGFAVENVCRLMVGGGDAACARLLLFSPRWIVKMLEMGRILQLEADVEMYVKHVEVGDELGGSARGTIPSVPTANDTGALKMLCKICRLCQSLCFQKEALAWFQLYARLHATCDGHEDEWMACMMRDIEDLVPKPWVKPVSLCMASARSPLLQGFRSSFVPGSVQMLPDGSVVSCGNSGRTFIANHFRRNAEIVQTTGEIPDVRNDWSGSTSDVSEGGLGAERRKPWKREKSPLSFSEEKQQSAPDGTFKTAGKMKTSLTTTSEYLTGIFKGMDTGFISGISESVSTEERGFNCMAISPDGYWAVSGGYETVRVWNMSTGAQVAQALGGHSRWVVSVAISTDGRLAVSGGEDKTVRVWNVKTGAQVGDALVGHSDWVRSVAISADGRRAVSGGLDKTVRVWNLTTGVQVGETLAGHSDWVRSVAISADGRRAVSGGLDKTVRVWDLTTGAEVREALVGHSGVVSSVAISSDGRRAVSGGLDMTVRVWDLMSGTQVGEALAGHTDWVRSVAVSADGLRAVSAGGEKAVRVWDVTTGAQVGDAVAGHSGSVRSVAISADERRAVSGGDDETVRVWELTTGAQEGKALAGHSDWVRSVAISADGRRAVSGGADSTVRVWDVTTGAQVGEAFAGHSDWVWSVAISADGLWAVSGGGDETVRVWDVRTGAQVGEALAGHSGVVSSVAISSDGRRAVSGGLDMTVRVWDVDSGICLSTECLLDDADLLAVPGAMDSRVAVRMADVEGCSHPALGCDWFSLLRWVVFDSEPHAFFSRGSLAVVGLGNGKVCLLRWIDSNTDCNLPIHGQSED